MNTLSRKQLLDELGKVVPREILLDSDEAMRPFECDGLSVYRKLPLLVALPENTTQVRDILRCCNRLNVPVVTRGAGTGLSGGALPLESGLLLVLTRLDRILEIDPVARTARVEPGVRNLAVSEAATPHSLYYAPDPSSQIACSWCHSSAACGSSAGFASARPPRSRIASGSVSRGASTRRLRSPLRDLQ